MKIFNYEKEYQKAMDIINVLMGHGFAIYYTEDLPENKAVQIQKILKEAQDKITNIIKGDNNEKVD